MGGKPGEGKAVSLYSLALLIGAVFAIELAIATFYVFSIEPYLERRHAASLVGNGPAGMPAATPFIWRGPSRPPTVTAAEATIADDAKVIGVEAGGQFRAYHLEALRRLTQHVVNDVLNDVPVTVTYCDLSGCVRAFTADQRGTPLSIMIGGLDSGELLVLDNGVFYFQRTGKARIADYPDLPYPPYPVTVTTWKKWRDAHPETDLFVSPPSVEDPEPFLIHPPNQAVKP